MYRPQVVLSVRDGLVQEVFASDPEVDVVIVDWDVAGDADEGTVAVPLGADTSRVIVTHCNIQPLHQLAGSDVERAIDAACACRLIDIA